MLSLKQVSDICLSYKGISQCRFLAEDDQRQYYCVKKTAQEKEINDEVNAFIKSQKENGVDYKQSGVPLGNNCQGYLFLKYKKQGYDC